MEENKDLLEVEKLLKQEKSRRMYERYQTVRVHLMGHNQQQISSIIGRSDRTVRSYLARYKTQDQQAQLKKTVIYFLPHQVGFPAKFNWTLDLIRSYIVREFGESYSIRGTSKLMHRMNMSYTKPTYTLAAADEENNTIAG